LLAYLSYLIEYPTGILKFQIDKVRGTFTREIPDLLPTIFYDNITKQTTISYGKSLPKEYDIIEYDVKQKKWFIVKEER